MSENKTVLLGMSGGVDSSVSAILLKEKGFEVYGVTMKLWKVEDENTKDSSYSLNSVNDAKKVCELLNIPHYAFNFKEEFKSKVIDNFICEYSNCKTPNPCIECNKYLKFGRMYQKAQELGIDYIATGHYAKTEYSEKYKRYVLKKANNLKKDQSYVLYSIPKELLSKIIFPLSDFSDKEEIRQIARSNNLDIANKPDSEDICFIEDGDYKKFLEENSHLHENVGNIVNTNGKVLGKHSGLYKYTIGQRKGLGISNNVPLFVIGFNKEKNELIVGEEDKLYSNTAFVNNINLLLFDTLTSPIEVNVKTRYSSREEKAIISQIDQDKIKIEFINPVARITPGQSAVFYIDDIVVGGGKII